MRITIDPNDARPIWSQLEDQLRRLIGSGALRPGAPVPSVRELARELVVNPATVARAYRELGDGGWLVVRRGQGTFVADEAPRIDDRERRRELDEAAERYVVVARTLGVDLDEAQESLQATWERFAATEPAKAVAPEAGASASERPTAERRRG